MRLCKILKNNVTIYRHAELVSASDQLDEESLNFNILKSLNISQIGKTLKLVQGDSKTNTLSSKQYIKAFTLSEVLITLVIIGIIAAITVQVIMNKYKWAQYRSAAFKAINTLDNAMLMYKNKEGYSPQCGFWFKNPYGKKTCLPENKNADGSCNKQTLTNGDDIPSDYNGLFNDCYKVFHFIKDNLNTVKYCPNNAYENGCSPEYDGTDTIYKNNHPDKSDEEVLSAINGALNFTKASMRAKAAIVTNDGMILMPQVANQARSFIIDINGFKGPNKFGHDLIYVQAQIKSRYDVPHFKPTSNPLLIDKGGISSKKLLYGKDVID